MFVNLTPHAITIRAKDGDLTIEPSGTVARVGTRYIEAGTIDGVLVVRRVFGAVENLPPPKPGVFYLVSSLVLDRVKDRIDVMAPDTGPSAIRDDQGRIVAVTRVVR